MATSHAKPAKEPSVRYGSEWFFESRLIQYTTHPLCVEKWQAALQEIATMTKPELRMERTYLNEALRVQNELERLQLGDCQRWNCLYALFQAVENRLRGDVVARRVMPLLDDQS